MNLKQKTVGDIREAIKELPDDVPLVVGDLECSQILGGVLRVSVEDVAIFDYDLDDDILTKSLVLKISNYPFLGNRMTDNPVTVRGR